MPSASVSETIKHLLLVLLLVCPIFGCRLCVDAPTTCITDLGSVLPPVYWINLEPSCHRHLRMGLTLQAHNFTNVRVVGVEGDYFALTPLSTGPRAPLRFDGPLQRGGANVSVWTSSGIINRKDAKRLTKGEVGCVLSHLRAFRQAFVDGHDMALVMEDDVTMELVPQWNGQGMAEVVRQVAAQSHGEWDLVQLTAMLFQKWPRKLFRAYFVNGTLAVRRLDDRVYGTQAYVVHRRGMARLLDRLWPRQDWRQAWPDRLDLRRIPNARADSLLYTLTRSYVATRSLFLYHVSHSAIATSTSIGQADNAKWIRSMYPDGSGPRGRTGPLGEERRRVCLAVPPQCQPVAAALHLKAPEGILTSPTCDAASTYQWECDDRKPPRPP
mmetsp:Transcript_28924/g.51957  ORF Transcript_28924/g.51957 Transcript_28924/m.51957 type:complete len:383 (-) Transcript_28924:45-1193(-)